MRTGELTESVARYREVVAQSRYAFWARDTYNEKRVQQLRNRAIRSIGRTPQSRYHKGWAK